MFTIKIADIPIGIDNRYAMVSQLCEKYKTKGERPTFTVKVSDEMLVTDFMNVLRQQHVMPSAERERLQDALKVEKPPVNEQEYIDIICSKKEMPAILLGTWCYLEELSIYRQICQQLIHFDAFVLHAAVIAIDGEAIAFVGKHGAGKSTRLLLWEKAFGNRTIIVNGDKPIIRLIDGMLYACGTPWNGKENLDNNCMVPLKTLCFVERSSQVQIRRLSANDVTQRIFEHLLLPENVTDLNHLIDLINILIEQIPCFLLKCSIENGEDPQKIWSQIIHDIKDIEK